MSVKTYLQRQIRLMALNSSDFFTDEEYAIYQEIINIGNEINKINKIKNKKEKPPNSKELISEFRKQKKDKQAELNKLIFEHEDTQRIVNVRNVLDTSTFVDGEIPKGITWNTLRITRKIAEFESEESRLLGLQTNEITLDKIIISWKSRDILRQITLKGFILPILCQEDGTIENREFRIMTASAGQLRTDKVQAISVNKWNQIQNALTCGMSWDEINSHGGINVSKLMAYLALPCSATETWDYPIDNCIVIKDFEADVTDMMQFIYPNYTFERGIRTVKINHGDGFGMMLPGISEYGNFMCRLPWIKGLLTEFDYIKFCKVNGCEAKIEDRWGVEHDLIKENIGIIFTESQFKLAKYYKSWDDYKERFKKYGCHFCRTNYEEPYIKDSNLNYQFIQTLVDFTNKEVEELTHDSIEYINEISTTKEGMLKLLGASEDAKNPYMIALNLYPELLRDGYAKDMLKNAKRRLLFDGRSGDLKCKSKRLFALPDVYAACEFWFLHDEHPKGLLENGYVAAKIYKNIDEVDVLRSPHLYQEHAIRKIAHDPKVYEWFTTKGIYTSCHDLITRILQLDVDGDMLNVVTNKTIINMAKRNIEKYNIVPLFYDAKKAPATLVSNQTLYDALIRAHEYSGIGVVSNSLTRLWNKDNPDFESAAMLCYFNNQVIDAAKTGSCNSYDNYPVKAQISKAIGGKNGLMPYFFQFSKNGRRLENVERKWAKPTNSIMNTICAAFDNVKNISMNYVDIPEFNYQMLLSEECFNTNESVVDFFCTQADKNAIHIQLESEKEMDTFKKISILAKELAKEELVEKVKERYGTIETIYPYLVKFLFTGENIASQARKEMFWIVCGNIAIRNLTNNLKSYSVCPFCNTKIPGWANINDHLCRCSKIDTFTCIDCGEKVIAKLKRNNNSKVCRCEACQMKHRREQKTILQRKYRQCTQ